MPRVHKIYIVIASLLFILLYFLVLNRRSGSSYPVWQRSNPGRLPPDPLPARGPPANTHPGPHPDAHGGVHPPPPDTPNNNNSIPAHLPSEHRCAPVPPKFPLTSPLFPCAWLSSLPPVCSQRLRGKLLCRPHKPVKMVYEWVSVDTPPSAYRFEDECLQRAVRSLCYQEGQEDLIPNLSHHVMFGGREMRNYTFLALLSSVRFLQPCLVMVHADVLPVGHFWDSLVRLLPHLIHVQRSPPNIIFGHEVKVIEHSSDIARLEAVKKFGGVYQDSDYILVNPVEDLRNYSVVMGKTIPNVNYCNCIFMAKPEARFLNAWYNSYRTFRDSQWALHSTIMPYKIHHQRPDLEFHEVNTFVTPYFGNIKKRFYHRLLNWTHLHGLHLYPRFFSQYFKGRFDQGNSSLGQVTRRILFGDSQACFGGRQLAREVVRMDVAYPTP